MLDHTAAFPDDAPDQLVPDPQVQKEFSVCAMTIDRWDKDPKMAELGWPPPIRIKIRKYRSRRLIERFKASLVKAAIAAARRLASRNEGRLPDSLSRSWHEPDSSAP